MFAEEVFSFAIHHPMKTFFACFSVFSFYIFQNRFMCAAVCRLYHGGYVKPIKNSFCSLFIPGPIVLTFATVKVKKRLPIN